MNRLIKNIAEKFALIIILNYLLLLAFKYRYYINTFDKKYSQYE